MLADPASADNPFFLLFPNWLLMPAVLLTTAATVIASQAVLSGAFALVQQAIQLVEWPLNFSDPLDAQAWLAITVRSPSQKNRRHQTASSETGGKRDCRPPMPDRPAPQLLGRGKPEPERAGRTQTS